MGIGKEIIMSGLKPHIPLLESGKNVTFALNMHLGWVRRAELAAVPIEPATVRTIGMVHESLQSISRTVRQFLKARSPSMGH